MMVMGLGRRTPTIAAVAAAALALAGCGGREKRLETASDTPAPVEKPKADEPAGPPATPGLPVPERLAKAVESLKAGDEPTARSEVRALLAEAPASREGLVLRQSIEGNPYDIVPRGSFSYIVQPGDTFISLAIDYLGDSYKFYALARISGIPYTQLKPGDIIQIPGRLRDPARPGAPRTSRPTRSRPRPTASVPPTTAAPVVGVRTDPVAAQRYRRQGLERMTAGQINDAVNRLSRAQQLDPGNRAIEADLARARRIQGAVRTRR